MKSKKAPPVKTSRTVGAKYKNTLLLLTKKLENDVNTQIVPLLRRLQPEYVNDAYALELTEALNNLISSYDDIDKNAKIVATSFVENSNQANKQRFYKSIEKAVGVDLQSIIQNEGLEDILLATTRENVNLIKSIPAEYFKNLETLIYTGTTQGRTAGSMIQQIQELGGVTENRARLIARDQSSKLNSALNQQRQQNLGVEEYIWRTAGDGEAPAGRERHSHHIKNGKKFRWDDPPKDTGHPGEDIQCRCIAQAVIKI